MALWHQASEPGRSRSKRMLMRSVLGRVSKHATTPMQRISKAADHPVGNRPLYYLTLEIRRFQHPVTARADARRQSAGGRFRTAGYSRSFDLIGAVVDLDRRALRSRTRGQSS